MPEQVYHTAAGHWAYIARATSINEGNEQLTEKLPKVK